MATKLLIIHSTRTAKNVDVTPNDIRKLHRSWGWNCAGYNAIIQPDGTVQKVDNSTIDPWNVTFKVIGSDHCARHIAYVGGLDKAKRTKDTRTSEQSLALHKYVYEFLKQNPDAKIAGINQFAEFQNPGFDVQTWLLSIGVNDSNIFIQ